MTINRLSALCAIFLLVSACGDDDGGGGGTDSGVDSAVPDTGADDSATGEDGATGDTGELRFWHLAAAAGTVDIYIDGEVAAPGVEFEQNSAYAAIDAGTHRLSVVPAGGALDDAAIDVMDFAIGAGERWTIIAAQLEEDGGFQALPVLEDAAPADGNVRLRVFHAAYAVGVAVDVHNATELTAPEIAMGVAQGEAAGAGVDVPAAALTIGLDIGAGAEAPGATDSIVDLLSGEIDEPVAGTQVLAGVISKPEGDETETELVFLVGDGANIHDETELEVAANARLWHLAPLAGMVDIYLDGELALEDVDFEGNTPYLPFSAGPVDVAITAADAPIGDAVISVDDYMLDAGTYHTIIAWQQEEDGNFQPLAIQEDRTAPADGSIRIRVFHVSYVVANAVDVFDAADDETALFSGVAQGTASEGSVEVPNAAYTLGIDITDPPDGTIDLTTAMPLDMPVDGAFLTIGVLSKPEADETETEVVFLINNGLHDEVELE
ncbi:MAG: DUF4397 domain-containing protein [Myxococcota bacterium]